MAETSIQKTMKRYGIVDPRDEVALEKRVGMTCAFLHMLRDHNLVTCKTAPHLASLDTRKRIQKLTYLASRVFEHSLGYWYNLYIYGPYSISLAADYYRISDVSERKSTTPKEWPEMGKFLEFVEGQSTDWLEAVTTLHYIAAKEKISGDELVSYVKDLKPRLDIRSAYNDIKDPNFWYKSKGLQ